MRINQIFEIDFPDAEKQATNTLDSLIKEDYFNYNTRWHIVHSPMKSNKNTKTVKSTNHLEDQENQCNHFF